MDIRTLKSLRQKHMHEAMLDLQRAQHNKELRHLKSKWPKLNDKIFRDALELTRCPFFSQIEAYCERKPFLMHCDELKTDNLEIGTTKVRRWRLGNVL